VSGAVKCSKLLGKLYATESGDGQTGFATLPTEVVVVKTAAAKQNFAPNS